MGLYKPKATLRELLAADPDIFLVFHLPDALGIDELYNIMVQELGDMATLFSTPSEWISYVSVWSANRVNNWTMMLNALRAEYNPIHNYDMQEQMTNDQTVTQHGKTTTRTDNLSHAKTGTEGDSMTASETPGVTQTTESGRYGVNSTTDPVPVDRAVTSRSGQDSRSGSSTRTYNTTDAETGTQTLADSGQDTQTRNYRLTRSGNIGVTTSQQLLEAEIALRVRYEIVDIIITDCKRDLFAAIW